MTMNYCGRCGSANGANARFCRQCGTELSSQAAFSSPSKSLNVEFAAIAPSKENIEGGTGGSVSDSGLNAVEDKSEVQLVGDQQEQSEQAQTHTPDPVSISKSLRRVRASGPLIIEAAKHKREQMNEIIAKAIEGSDSPDKLDKVDPGAEQTRAEGDRKLMVGSTSGAATRRTTAGSPVRKGNLGGLHQSYYEGLSGQLPPNGPSSVLAQASGLKPQPGLGSKFRVGLIALAVLLATGTYFIFRDKILTTAGSAGGDRDLMRVEDQSSQFVWLGERDREQGHYDSAIEYFQRALALTPNNPKAHFLLAQTFLSAGQTDEAMKSYTALLRLAPEHLEGRLQLAEIHRERGNWNAAYREYQRIIALDQNSPQATVALEMIEAQQSGDSLATAAALRRRQRTANRNSLVLPPTAGARTNVSLVTQRNTPGPALNPPASLTGNREADNPDPRLVAETRKKLGLRYLNVREFRAAINEFLAALRLTPEDKDLYYFLGSSYYGLGQHAQAHEYYIRVDRGQYFQVAQSGAQRTEKAAREEFKRRMDTLRNETRNELNKRSESADKDASGKVIMNGFKE